MTNISNTIPLAHIIKNNAFEVKAGIKYNINFARSIPTAGLKSPLPSKYSFGISDSGHAGSGT